MTKRRAAAPLPACYAIVLPGLEAVAEDEITRDLGGEVKRSGPGFVVFRADPLDTSLLRLRTTEDVFLLAWGTDDLSYRAVDLDKIRRWTAYDADWNRLLQIHHGIRPKPKSKPTFHLVAQMTGTHGYRRIDARKAVAEGLAGKLPASWRPAEENAAVEVWLTIHGATALCGLRLSDRTMRHRTYKIEHLPASLRPTLAASMVRLAEIKPRQVVLDPMCGAGTILAEVTQRARDASLNPLVVLGGDLDKNSLRAAGTNLRRVGGRDLLARWDAIHLPLPDGSVDRIVTNPPFGKQLSHPELIGGLYRRVLTECDRVLRPHGIAVFLVSDWPALKAPAASLGWRVLRQHRVRVLGQMATLASFRRGSEILKTATDSS